MLAPGVELDGWVWPAAGLAMVIASMVPSRAERTGRVTGAVDHVRRAGRIAGLAGAVVLLWGLRDARQAWASAQWPRVNATLIHSGAHSVSGGSVVSMWFEYEVGGVRFVSDRVRIGGNVTPSVDDAVRIVSAHPSGSTVEVAYDPEHPDSAVLQPGLDWRHAVLPLIGLVILAGVALASLAARAGAKRSDAAGPTKRRAS